jgi:NADH-quinone oxidoreductase subunit N
MLADVIATLPLSIVLVTGCLVCLINLVNEGDNRFLGRITALGFGLSILMSYLLWGREISAFSTGTFGLMMAMGKYEILVCAVLASIGLVVALLSADEGADSDCKLGSHYALLNFAVLGMMVLASATNLVTLFLGFEIMSFAMYALSTLKRGSVFAVDAGIKYLVVGALASGLMLYGMAFVYGETVVLDYAGIVTVLYGAQPTGFLALGLTFLTVAFACKIALVPFHHSTPDVYEGAPTSVAALMATGVKAASVIAMARFFVMVVPASVIGWLAPDVFDALWILAAVTMTVANLIAIQQRSIKRMLGYSSIAHAGYLLVAILAAHTAGDPSSPEWGSGMGSIFFYLFAYVLANLAAFGVLSLFEKQANEHITLDNIGGLAKQHGLAACILLVGMLSLAGVPPTGGFWGRLVIFRDALAADFDKFIWLVVIASVNSVIGAFYYLRVILCAFMTDADGTTQSNPLRTTALAVLVVTALASLQIGIFPARWVGASSIAAAGLPGQVSDVAEKKSIGSSNPELGY